MSINNYQVGIEEYAKKHFIKKFTKNYGKAWLVTQEALAEELKSFKVLLARSIASPAIISKDELAIHKIEFKIAGSNKSRHSSGNRLIISVDNKNNSIKTLLLYHKKDLGKKTKETAAWKQIIKENYPEYRSLL